MAERKRTFEYLHCYRGFIFLYPTSNLTNVEMG